MKFIKKSLLAIGIMTFCGLDYIIAQPYCSPPNTPGNPLPCWYTPNWDWLNTASANWEAQIAANTVPMGSPFTSNTNTNDMVRVIDAVDYLPAQGWVLLTKDFGCVGGQAVANATPYFMLYNKYRSVVRVFLYLGNQANGTRASVTARWDNPSSNNSLLTMANDYLKPNSSYPLPTNSEKHVNYLNQVATSGGWVITEFVANYDPNTVNSLGNFQRLTFDFGTSTAGVISLTGDFNFTTESATPKNPPAPTVNGSNNALLDFVVTARKFLGKAPKVSDLTTGFANIVSGTDTINKIFQTQFTRDLKRTSDALNNSAFKKFLIGTSTVAEKILGDGYLQIASSVLEIFVGKSNVAAANSVDSYVQPTVSKGSVKLNGTITTAANPLSLALQLPGTSHKFADGTINCPGLPVYDCPLGLISLQTAPSVEKKTHSVFAGFRQWTTDTFSASHQPPFFQNFHGANINEQYNSYRVNSTLQLALNGAVGVTIDNVKASLVAVQDVAVQPFDSSYVLISDRFSSTGTGRTGYNELTAPPSPLPAALNTMSYNRSSLEKAYISNGIYILNAVDQTNKVLSYSTPFIEIEKFNNTVIVAQPAMKILLKLLITLYPNSPTDDQTPIIYLLTYDLSNYITTAGSANPSLNGPPAPFTCTQQEKMISASTAVTGPVSINSGLTSGIYIQTRNAVTINANTASNVNFKGANRIQLSPGFIADATGTSYFRAYLDKTGQCLDGTNALSMATTLFTGCTPSSTDRIRHNELYDSQNPEINLTLSNNSQSLKMYVAPNPNNGEFKLLFNKNVEAGKIRIINTLNQEVYSKNLEADVNTSAYDINLNQTLTAGTYYILWNNSKFVLTQKFIIE